MLVDCVRLFFTLRANHHNNSRTIRCVLVKHVTCVFYRLFTLDCVLSLHCFEIAPNTLLHACLYDENVPCIAIEGEREKRTN